MISIYRNGSAQFEFCDFNPKGHLSSPLKTCLLLNIFGCVLIICIEWLSTFRSVEYYREAVSQLISPHLWNMMGSAAVILLGLSVIFCGCYWLVNMASHVFHNAFKAGALMLGLLVGQFLVLLPFFYMNMPLWKFLLLVGLIFSFFYALFLLNFALWYGSFLLSAKSKVLGKLKNIAPIVRVGVGTAISFVMTVLVWLEM